MYQKSVLMNQNQGNQPKSKGNVLRILDLKVFCLYLLEGYKLRRIEFFRVKSIVYQSFSRIHVVKLTVLKM